MQEAPTQMVPTGYVRQAPAPLQLPSVPQLATPLSAHWISGSSPAGTLVQVPTLPVRLQTWQVLEHGLPQQTPCAQMPDAHSAPVTQAAAMGLPTHRPLPQVLGAGQS